MPVGGQAVHPGNDRALRVLAADRHRNRGGPYIRLLRVRYLTHAVALVAQIPGRNGRMLPEAAHHQPDEADFPLYGDRIRQYIAALQHFRHKQTAAHPSGQKAHNQLQTVLFRQIAELPEAFQHNRVHARAACFVKGQRRFGQPFLPRLAMRAHVQAQGLEIAPQGENPQCRDPRLRQTAQILLHRAFVPVAPHEHARVGRPVVASDKKSALLKMLRIHFHSSPKQ